MLYIAQQWSEWDNEHFFMLQDFQECPNLQSTSISKGEQSQKRLAEQVRACPEKMQRAFLEYKEQHRAGVPVPAAVCTHGAETLSWVNEPFPKGPSQGYLQQSLLQGLFKTPFCHGNRGAGKGREGDTIPKASLEKLSHHQHRGSTGQMIF